MGVYDDYLTSEHWKQIRDRKLEEQDWQCERCGHYARRDHDGARIGLDVHHLTYERLGREEMADLEALCRTCHEEEHGIPGPSREVRRAKITNHINRRGLDFEPDEEELVAMGLLRSEVAVEIDAWDRLAEQADG